MNKTNLIINFLNKHKLSNNDFIFIFVFIFFLVILFFFNSSSIELLSLTIVASFTFYLSRKHKPLATILYLALIVRLIALFLGNYFVILPDSWGDTQLFQNKAIEYSRNGFFNIFKLYPASDPSYNLSWFLAFFFYFSENSALIIGQSISLIFGISSIFLGSYLAYKFWGQKVSTKVAWILAFYPTLVLYSILILREAYIWLFLLLAIYGIYLWKKFEGFKPLMIIFFGFSAASFFHGGMIFGLIAFLIIIISNYTFQFLKQMRFLKVSKRLSIKLILFFFIFLLIILNLDLIPKLHLLKEFLNFEKITMLISKKNISNASYPQWLVPNSSIDFFYIVPIKTIYFLFSPFVWDISNIKHFLGLFDGLIFMIMFFYIFKNLKLIWKNPTLKIFLIVLFLYFVVYGLVTGNFGTALRHRTKFFIPILLIAAPFLPNLTLLLKNNFKKFFNK